MQMIDTDIFWYGETFKAILMELRKIRHGETMMNACETLDENVTFKSAMMCWENLDDSEPTSKKTKTLSQEEATNDQANEIDNKLHTKRTAKNGLVHLSLLTICGRELMMTHQRSLPRRLWRKILCTSRISLTEK